MKIAILGNSSELVWVLRRDFISDLIRLGHDITVVVPAGEMLENLASLGASISTIPLKRHTSPLADAFCFLKYWRLFRSGKFDIVYAITSKPNTYGIIAAWLAGVPKRIGLISGLGTGFIEAEGFRLRCLQMFARTLFRVAGRCTNKFLFQNEDDRRFMIEARIISESKTHVIKSSGINFDVFSPERIDSEAVLEMRTTLFGVEANTIVIGIIARAIESKGIREFIQVSEEAATWNRKVRFIHVGEFSASDPQSLALDELKETKMYRWLGKRSDIPIVVQAMDVTALPSCYREGVPRSLIEGMALSKPLVTTDHVGCKETVDDGVNGFLVPTKDATALAEAIKKLVFDDDLRLKMGKASREKAEREFDVRDVNRRIITEVLELSYNGCDPPLS